MSRQWLFANPTLPANPDHPTPHTTPGLTPTFGLLPAWRRSSSEACPQGVSFSSKTLGSFLLAGLVCRLVRVHFIDNKQDAYSDDADVWSEDLHSEYMEDIRRIAEGPPDVTIADSYIAQAGKMWQGGDISTALSLAKEARYIRLRNSSPEDPSVLEVDKMITAASQALVQQQGF